MSTLDSATAGKAFIGGGFMVLGVGVGYWMYRSPEGLNPEWGLWIAEVVPAAFAIGGMFLVADAFGFRRLAVRLLQLLMWCMLLLAHWIAFFVTGAQCSVGLSLLGIDFLTVQPDDWMCRFVFLVIVLMVDVVAIFVAVAGWRRSRDARPPA